jgi:hypothetical protein
LLYCPEQGGWHTGEWVGPNFVSSKGMHCRLEATHLIDAPPNAEE